MYFPFSGDVPSASEDSSGLQLMATTAEPMSLEQWNATEDESSKTEDKVHQHSLSG